MGVDLGFQAELSGQSLGFDGRWAWDLTEGGFTLDVDSSGLDADSLTNALAELAAEGISLLENGTSTALGGLKSIHWLGPGVADSLGTVLGDAFALDEDAGSVRESLEGTRLHRHDQRNSRSTAECHNERQCAA